MERTSIPAGFETIVLDARFADLDSAEIATVSPYAALAVDNLTAIVGIEKPILAISPASGSYVTSQAFDLTLIVVGETAASAEILDASLDGVDEVELLTGGNRGGVGSSSRWRLGALRIEAALAEQVCTEHQHQRGDTQ